MIFFYLLGENMKIIQDGLPGGLWSKEVKCTGVGNGNSGCGALLEVQAPDLFHTSSSDYGGGTDHYITFECPCCKSWNDISTMDVPSGVRYKVLAEPNQVPGKPWRSPKTDNGTK